MIKMCTIIRPFVLLQLGIQAFCLESYSASFQAIGKSYEIAVKMSDLPDGIPFYLIRLSNGDTVSTVRSLRGMVLIKGTYEIDGEMHFLKYDSSGMKLPRSSQTWIRLYFDEKPIVIEGVFKEWPEVRINGSPSAVTYKEVLKDIVGINKEANDRIFAMGADSTVIREVIKESNIKIVNLILEYGNEYAAADLSRKVSNLEYFDLKKIYEKLTLRVQSSYAGKMLYARMEQLNRNAIVKFNIIPNFSIKDSVGDSHSILELIKKSRYTLIDFWASWCKPCIDGMENLRSTSDSFSASDFQIIGVSIDRNMRSWLSAVYKIKPNWIQGLDENGMQTKQLFGFQAIPMYLLVDRSGRMLAFHCAKGDYKSFGESIDDGRLIETLNAIIRK